MLPALEVLTTGLPGKSLVYYYYLHFIAEETGAHRGELPRVTYLAWGNQNLKSKLDAKSYVHITVLNDGLCLCAQSFSHVKLCHPMDCSLPSSSVCRIFQARIVE